MQKFNRKKTPKIDEHQTPTDRNLKQRKASPLAEIVPLVQRRSLLRLQVGLAGLLRNRARIEMRIAKAIASKRLDQAKVLAKLHLRTTETAQRIADEIAERTRVHEAPKPKPSGNRKTRDTKAHSRVRRGSADTVSAEHLEPIVKQQTETTRHLEAEREADREAFKIELERRLKA